MYTMINKSTGTSQTVTEKDIANQFGKSTLINIYDKLDNDQPYETKNVTIKNN